VTRVLFVQGAGERGGAETALAALTGALPAFGVEPVVATLADGPFIAELEASGVEVERLAPAPRARQFWRTADVVEPLARVVKSTGAELVHSSGEKMAWYGGRAARRADVPSVVWLHDAPLRSPSSAALQLAMVLRRHDALTAGSRWMARSFRKRLGLKVEPIPIGVDLARLPAAPADVRRLVGLPDDAIVVGHFARLQRWKGTDVFLRSAAQVAPRHPAAHFVVVGGSLYGWEQEYADSLPGLAQSLGLDGRVHFLGHRDDALGLMAGCDVVVHASVRAEPLGIVVIEAMALGRAVVATRTGGPEEIIDDGVTGLLVPPGDPEELARAIDTLVGDAVLRDRLGKAGQVSARNDWSATTMAERFAALYGRLTMTRSRT